MLKIPLLAASLRDHISPYRENKSDFKNCNIAICMVFRNEGPYLKEWIEFHRLVGVGHFFLYNNLSEDNYLEVLRPYLKQGVVELFDFAEPNFNQKNSQITVYNHALRQANNKCEWLAIIDSDEFICPVNVDTLDEVLQNYKEAAGLCVFWQCYGTSGVENLGTNDLLIEKLIFKLPPNADRNRWVKSIVRPKFAKKMLDAHRCEYVKGAFAVFSDHQQFERPYPFFELPIGEIRINHYIWRTEEYYRRVKLPRILEQRHIPVPTREQMDAYNEVEDRIMERFVARLRLYLRL